MTTQTLLDFDLSESSDDSDFRIEDHDDDSDDLSINTNDDHSYNNDDSDDDDDSGGGGGDDGDSDNSDINKLDSNDKKVCSHQQMLPNAGNMLIFIRFCRQLTLIHVYS